MITGMCTESMLTVRSLTFRALARYFLPVLDLEGNDKLTYMCLNPRSPSAALCSATDGSIRQWDMRTGGSSSSSSIVQSFTAHEEYVPSFCWVCVSLCLFSPTVL
jgi:WD40 repeat protein